MTKYICDRCEKDFKSRTALQVLDAGLVKDRWLNTVGVLELCQECVEELKYFLAPLKGVKHDTNTN